MIRQLRNLILICSLVVLGAACGAGVEVGNPAKVGGKVVTLDLVDSPETYIIEFEDEDSAEVSKVLDAQFETVSGPVTISGDSIQVTANFASGTFLEASFQLDDAGELVLISLQIDGAPVEVEVSSETEKPSLKAFWSNDALLVVATICRRVEECQPSTPAAECETDLAEVAGLAQSFGGAPGQSLKQESEALESGASQSDPVALEACLADIAILPCTQVDKSHNPSDPHNYQQAHKLVPKPACNRAFSHNP